jgi:hypothetical protein
MSSSKGSGTCNKLSACSRLPVQPHLLASCYWVPVSPQGKYKPSHSCNRIQERVTSVTPPLSRQSAIMSQSIVFTMLALAASVSADPSITSPAIYSSSVTSPPILSSSVCSLTVCADYINSCGQTYGGCYETCDGFTTPSFTDPGCPSTTDSPSNTTPPPETSSCFLTLCVDNMNSCSQMYGGCFPACGNYTTPSFTDPGCPSTTRTSAASCTLKPHSTSTTTSSTSGMVTSSKPLTTSTPSSSTSCTQTVCADYINSCGLMYGGCFPYCSGYTMPSFSVPDCPTSYSPSTRTSTAY